MTTETNTQFRKCPACGWTGRLWHNFKDRYPEVARGREFYLIKFSINRAPKDEGDELVAFSSGYRESQKAQKR